jgi:ubiquinone/menaquinone biosynthesis C-methylase UbiE
LLGVELNERSANSIVEESIGYPEISAVRADALRLPLADNSCDYAISSLFAHHLTEPQIVAVFKEMSRVARRGVFVIDLHRHPLAYVSYKAFCVAFRISRLVREDGSLSILRGFKPSEMTDFAKLAGCRAFWLTRSFPFRLVLRLG